MQENVPHPVLKGFSVIATTNPAGARHQLDKLPPALEREFAEIKVDYPPQSAANPELYEFMLAQLMDDKGYVAIPKNELAPAYRRVEVAGRTTQDGQEIAAEYQVMPSPSDASHGALWRLAGALRAIQDSYTADNPDDRARLEPSLLRIGANGNIVAQGGEPLTLQSSTMTLKEIGSWMRGFSTRMQSADPSLRTETFSDWLAYKAGVFISQCPPLDRAKLEAIFKNFGILNPAPTSPSEPMTNLDIGYLSPRVPRSLEIKGEAAGQREERRETMPEARTIESVEYVTETGERVRAKPADYDLGSISGSRYQYFLRSGATFKRGAVEYAGVNANKPDELILVSGKLARSLSKDAFIAELSKECVVTWEAAEKAIGKRNLWGPDSIQDAFGFTPQMVSVVPYSKEELKEYQQFDCLVQCVTDKDSLGNTLSIEQMAKLAGSNKEGKNKYRLYNDQFDDSGAVKPDAWFSGPQYAAMRSSAPKAGCQVVSRNSIDGTKSKNYIQQTERLIEYAKERFGGTLPPVYVEAEREFIRERPNIEALMNGGKWVEACDAFSKLSISQLLREPFANTFFRYIVGTKSRSERLLPDEYTWSSTPSGGGHLVSFGDADAEGAFVDGDQPGNDWDNVGAVFSRIES